MHFNYKKTRNWFNKHHYSTELLHEKKIPCKNIKKTKLKSEKQSIINVARFGVTPILIKPFAIRFTIGLKKFLNLNLEAIFYTNL